MSTINPVATRTDSNQGAGSANGALPNPQNINNMFLQLLVAQLQNQSPLDPMDPSQFVGQLAQFSELSEVTQIEQILQQAVPTTSGSTGTGSANGHMPVNSPAPMSLASAKARAAMQNANSASTTMPNHQTQGVF